jgi:hypothetical protein
MIKKIFHLILLMVFFIIFANQACAGWCSCWKSGSDNQGWQTNYAAECPSSTADGFSCQYNSSYNPGSLNGQSGGAVQLDNPLGDGKTDINVIIGQVISVILGVVGSIALLMFVYGGVVWMTSSGNQEKITKGKNIIVWAIMGLLMIFASYGIIKFLLTKVITGVT